MKDFSKTNKTAWEYKSYDFWVQNCGLPKDFAKKLKKDPEHALRHQREFLGDINDKKIANVLGSNGRKAIPLALLGADVTVIDISEPNKRYALELAKEAGVKIRYELCDFLEFDTTIKGNDDYDVLYLEGGILHYFEDIDVFTKKLSSMLKTDGNLILHDFHPFRKIIREVDSRLELYGDYFNDKVKIGNVAYSGLLKDVNADEMPKCVLRYYTLGEVITSLASSGFHIEKLKEYPRYDKFKEIPGNFIIYATKSGQNS